MNNFKPTHRLGDGGHAAQLVTTYTCRRTGEVCGLFFLPFGDTLTQSMKNTTKLPKMIHIEAYDEPEPLRIMPQRGDEYWIVSPGFEKGVRSALWMNSAQDNLIFASGEAYATMDIATAVRDARQKAKGFS